jgi:hypothetical protein
LHCGKEKPALFGQFFKIPDNLLYDDNRREFPAPAIGKINLSVNEGEKGVILAATHIRPRVYPGSPLPDDDRACLDYRTAGRLDAKVMGIGIPPIFRAAAAPFTSHVYSSA